MNSQSHEFDESYMMTKVQTEDALKHLHDCAYRGVTPTAEGLAGALALTVDGAAVVLAELEASGWVARRDGAYGLTTAGTDYARQVIRAHRLVESQLATETGVEAPSWHRIAEQREHVLTPREVDDLSRRLGDPRFDPHGDPIPTPAGALPVVDGVPLIDLPTGREGRIAHIEDEPESVYRELVATRLAPGFRIRVFDNTARGVRINAEGEIVGLSRAAAANVRIAPLAPGESFDASVARLSSLGLGEVAEVVGLLPSCRGLERRRLLDLGVVPGTRVTVDLVSPSGDPTAYSIRGAAIALRRVQAERILIRRGGS